MVGSFPTTPFKFDSTMDILNQILRKEGANNGSRRKTGGLEVCPDVDGRGIFVFSVSVFYYYLACKACLPGWQYSIGKWNIMSTAVKTELTSCMQRERYTL